MTVSPSEIVKTALVTGGAARVGRAVVLHLARQGWDVAITYHTSVEAMSRLSEDVDRLGKKLIPISADFTKGDEAAKRVADATAGHFDRLGLLLHNASVYEPASLQDVTPEVLRRDWAVHVETPLLLTKRLRPNLEAANGTVIAMTDADLDRTRPSYLSYHISKAGLAAMVRNLARELAPKVTVNAIAPGAVMWAKGMSDAEKATYLERVPLGRAASPGDVPSLVEFLATSGRYITGETIRLDGGRSLR